MADFTKPGRPRIGLKKREIQVKFFVDEDEAALFADLVALLGKRRHISSRVDTFVYLVNREFHRQDKIKIVK